METYNDNLQEEIIIVIAVLSGIHNVWIWSIVCMVDTLKIAMKDKL